MSLDLKDFRKLKKEYESKISKDGSIAIKKALKEFFVKYPNVECIQWDQYTPYFNDGEPCVFRMSDIVIKFNTVDDIRDNIKKTSTWKCDYKNGYDNPNLISPLSDEELLNGGERGEGLYDLYEMDDGQLKSDLSDIGSSLHDAEDVLEVVFGNHTRVKAYKNRVDLEEYTDHD